MYCICCNENVVSPVGMEPNYNEEDLLWEKGEYTLSDGSKIPTNINNSMVNNGIIHIINAGYGSKHDTSSIIIAICDRCIDEKLEDSTLLYYDNYFNYRDNDDVDKSKTKYRRRKNLDNLTDGKED